MIKPPRTSLTSRFLLCALSFVFLLGSPALAQNNLPPVIDREILFGNPEIARAQISPDGKFIAFLKPHQDTLNIWVKRADEPFANARLLTNEPRRPVRNFFWSRDGKFILFVNDQGGDENFNLYAVNPNEQPPSGAEVPVARNLTNSEKVRTLLYNVPRAEPDAVYIGINDRDPAWHDLYKVKISTGERTLVRQNTERLTDWLFDNKDQLRLATRSTRSGDKEILRVDAEGKFTKVYSCSVFETCGLARFNKDNRRVYMISNKGAGVDLARLVLFDPQTGTEEVVESDPMRRVDLEGAAFSDMTGELLFTGYTDDRQRLYIKDKAFAEDYKFLQKKLPNREISFDSSTTDEMTWLISATSDTEPGEKYLFDRKSKKLELQYRIREKLPRAYLTEQKPVRYKSSDGLEIPAYLALPKGLAPKNLPTIILPHGGPWSRDRWGYDSMSQFLTNRGYAVLSPNFRGSTGYGKKFLDAGNGQWGDKMQDDLTWGAKYLISQGISDPKRIAIMGASYGGYATLAGVTSTPDLYAAAVAIVAPSNLITLLEAIPAYWEAERIRFHKRMGDPTTAEGKAQLIRQSPLTHAGKIKTPLLVVQGANDPRVNKREADQIVIALRDRGFPVEYVVAPDEGHGFARPVNRMAMLALTEKFLAKYLGGRYQESLTPDVAKRLQEITVDPKTVKLAANPTGK
ncbi:MAG TPA: S9 family peptidase [Pyrinomonadaceae bacterium]|nr:S9 family peptidase [Pyrinomonadaceae bacterium]